MSTLIYLYILFQTNLVLNYLLQKTRFSLDLEINWNEHLESNTDDTLTSVPLSLYAASQ